MSDEELPNIIAVDDDFAVRMAMDFMFKKWPEYNLILAEDPNDALVKLDEHEYMMMFSDINMPVMSGVEATEIITQRYGSVSVLALTMHEEPSYVSKMVNAGALGYVLKGSKMFELESAIKAVAYGTKYYSSSVSISMINSLIKKDKQKYSELSNREKEVLICVANGSTNQEIGIELNISKRTVETHRRNILGKLEVRNTAEMIRYALQNNLTS